MKEVNKSLKIAGLLCLCLYLAACGGGGGSSGSDQYSSKLADKKIISEIDAQDYQKLCHRLNSWVQSHNTRTSICTLAGVIFGELVDEQGNSVNGCTSLVDECEHQSANHQSDEDESCIVNSPDKLASCSAPISELDSCLNDYLGQVDALLASVSCSIAGDKARIEEIIGTYGQTPPTENCLSLKAKCPELFRKPETQQP
ncbi:MAG: hypothetical protein K1X79_07235 [Oligoflexia bacterium]|nr:hypothetical protein [Oligoflexia bacterium]